MTPEEIAPVMQDHIEKAELLLKWAFAPDGSPEVAQSNAQQAVARIQLARFYADWGQHL